MARIEQNDPRNPNNPVWPWSVCAEGLRVGCVSERQAQEALPFVAIWEEARRLEAMR